MTTLTEQPNAAWARFYVAQGWKLIPIHVLINGWCSCNKRPCGDTGSPGEAGYVPAGKNAGKHPVQNGWTSPAAWVSSDAGVQRTWGDPRGIPYSIGLVCGAASGVWILDVDPRNGGFESLERLEAEWGESLPKTRVAVTGSGGRHFFFRVPDGLRLKKGPLHKDYPGLDVQAEGAQSVLAPSFHASGSRYDWLTPPDHEVAHAPQVLLDMVAGDRGAKGAGLGGAPLDLQKLMETGVPEGARNDTLHKVACSFARKLGVDTDLQKQLVVGAVEAFNQEFVRPPLEVEELRKLVISAIGFIASNPGAGELPDGVKQWLEARQGGGAGGGGGGAGGDADTSTGGGDAPAVTADATTGAGAAGNAAGGGSGAVGGAGGGGGPLAPGAGPNNFGPSGLPPDNDSLGPDGLPGMRTLTDNGNARRIVDYYGDELRFTAGLGWHRWDALTWRHDQEDLFVTGLARELPVRIVAEVANYPNNPAMQDELLKFASHSRSAGAIRKAVALANTDPRIIVPVSVWDSDPFTVGVANGVVDLRTGNLVPPARDQYITKRTAVAYRPGLRDTRFSIWLDQVTGGDKDLAAWLQRWAGYCLTAETREEKFVMLYGPAGTGKSTFLELVKAAAGDYGMTLEAEAIMAQKYAKGNQEYYNAMIYGMRVITISELPEAESMKEDSVKRLTGGDSMTGRKVAGTPFNFTSHAKLMIGTNNRPRVKDNAMWRRVRLVPFMHVPQVADESLKPYLLDPQGGLGAFLSWAVEGAVQWYAHGLGRCGVVDEATAEYKEAEDEVGIFLREELRAGEGLQVSMADVHSAWKLWAEDRGLQSPGHVNKLMRTLVDRGLEVEGTGRRATVMGWALLPKAVPTGAGATWAELVNRAR